MKKSLIIFLLIISCSFLTAVDSMGIDGVADSKHLVNKLTNPAIVYFYNQAEKFIFTTGVSNGHLFDGEPYLYSPQAFMRTQFVGEKISLGIDVNSFLKNAPTEDKKYNVQRDVVFDMNVAFGIGDVALGLKVSGGSSMEQLNVTNLFYQSTFGRYSRIKDSPFVGMSLGVMFKYNNFAVGALADGILSYNAIEEELSVSKAFDNVSAGLYWNMEKYGKRGRLNNWLFDASVEFTSIFKEERRAVNLGTEVTLQLTNEYSLSYRAGAQFKFADLAKPQISTGFGVQYGKLDFDLYVDFPIAKFTEQNPFRVNLNFSVMN